MKIVSIVGARPQFVKLAPIAEAMLAEPAIKHFIVHTGQHYDADMSDVFFEGLNIPAPDINLAVGSASHGAQTGAMISMIEETFLAHRPDLVLVYGDTNSTLAGALAAVKIHIPVVHLEAGLRSFNRRMPEEHNRVMTDHAADLLLAPTEVAMGHLAHEGLEERSRLVGDVMADVCLRVHSAMQGREVDLPPEIDSSSPMLLATIHRAENTDEPNRLRMIVESLRQTSFQVLLLAHPRLVKAAASDGIELGGGGLVVGKPMPYHEMVATLSRSSGVVTDSGGLQKEAHILGIPCTTVRSETEWVETLDDGWNQLCPDPADIPSVAGRTSPGIDRSTPFGDGRAAHRVVEELVRFQNKHISI